MTRESASIEAMYGDLDRALDLFDVAIASQHQANNVAHTAAALASLAVCFDRLDSHEIAAIIYGASSVYGSANRVKGLRHACEHLAESLGPSRFEQCVAQGAAMTLTDAVRFARQHISRQRSDRRHGSGAQTVGQ